MEPDILKLFFSHITPAETEFIVGQTGLPRSYIASEIARPLNIGEMYNLISENIPVNRKNGRYFTPPIIAHLLVGDLEVNKNSTVIEPSAGIGIFVFELLNHFCQSSQDKISLLKHITLIEKDSLLYQTVKLLLLHYIFLNRLDMSVNDIDIRNNDFLITEIREKYDIVLGNPPFVDTKFMPNREKYKSLFPLTSRNLFSMFLERAMDIVRTRGEISFIVSESFLYLKSYDKLRKKILNSQFDVHIQKLDKSVFSGADIGSIVIHLKNLGTGTISVLQGNYKAVLKKRDLNIKDYTLPFNSFEPAIIKILKKNESLSKHVTISVGLETGNVKRYVTDAKKTNTIPYVKRLKRRKSYWQNINHHLLFELLKKEKPNVIKQKHIIAMKKEGIVFNNIDHDSIFIAVYKPKGYLFDIVTPCIIPVDTDLYYLLGFLNSDLAKYLLYKLNATPHTNINDVLKLPYNDINFDVARLARHIVRNRQRGIETDTYQERINALIYEQFGVSKRLKKTIEIELYNCGLKFDKME